MPRAHEPQEEYVLHLLRTEWKAILPMVLAIARRITRNPKLAEELVAQTYHDIADGKRRWKDRQKPFKNFVMSSMGSIWLNERRSAAERTRNHADDPDKVPSWAATPDEIRDPAAAKYERIVERVRAALEGHALALAIFTSAVDDGAPAERLSEQAERLGRPKEEVDLARRKIKREIQRATEQEKEEEKT
jgi:DNA-directed RNA polymerase specialized sigma24 family protein